MPAVWAGVDSGKRTHHCVVINQIGMVLLSRRVNNDEAELLELIGAVVDLADGDQVCWATDLNAGGPALLITLLAAHSQRLLYIPGRVVHHAAATYQGSGKTDAKDARIIADQARMRTDLQPVREADQISVDLRMLTARRTDLVCDRVRAINRLRATLLEYFPALEPAFDYSKNKAALTLLSEPMGSTLVIRLAAEISAIDRDLVELDAQLTDRFRQHEAAEILLSVPGFGPVLAATFLANIGGNLNGFDTVDRLAAVAGLAPVSHDSGRISGNLHRPRRFNRRLLRTCYLAALSSLKNSPASRAFYDRKRREGKSHKQALIALARRRLNVIWALLRDRAHYQEPALTAA